VLTMRRLMRFAVMHEPLSGAKHLSGRVDQSRASLQVGRVQGRFANRPCFAFAQNDKVGQDAGVPFARFMLVTPSA